MEKLLSPHEIRFAAFAVDLQAGELRKHGVKIRLQKQPFQMLSELLERPGEVVTREELQKKLWSGGTFVDFEHSLATALKKLRRALGDSAVHPQFIETLARRGYRFIATLQEKPQAGKPILAVLPFENLTGNAREEYLSDGMTEEMIARLGRLYPQRLGVIAMASAIRYKNTNQDIDQIGRELGADYVLKGSLRRAGDRVRVSVELIRVKDRTHLWADRFEGARANVLAIHGEVARRIAGSLRVESPPAQRAAMAGASATNPEAHGAFLKGRYGLNKGTAAGVKKAIEHFAEATSKDSGYAVAYAGLAVALDLADHFRVLSGQQAFPRAKAAAIRALELNPLLPEAHNALAFARHSFDWDWAGAEQIYQRAIELNPNFATARHWHGFYLGMLGRVDEALAEMRRAQRLNPLSLIIRTHLGLMLHWGAGTMRRSNSSARPSKWSLTSPRRTTSLAGPMSKREGTRKRSRISSKRWQFPRVVPTGWGRSVMPMPRVREKEKRRRRSRNCTSCRNGDLSRPTILRLFTSAWRKQTRRSSGWKGLAKNAPSRCLRASRRSPGWTLCVPILVFKTSCAASVCPLSRWWGRAADQKWLDCRLSVCRL